MRQSSPEFVPAEAVATAARRIAPHVRRTPLDLTRALGPTLAFKAEHFQRTGSFKVRGALNRLLALAPAARRRGVTTASTGNHGIGVATAGALLAVPVAVHLAEDTDPAIVARLRGLGAEVVSVPGGPLEAELAARRGAEADGRTFVSPYNDPLVVAGQGTVALESLEQLGEIAWEGLDAVVVAVGGGGLISGIATWIDHAAPEVRVVGAQPAQDAAMHASVRAGRVVEVDAGPTLSHSTAGGLETDTITLPLCRTRVDAWIEVPEPEIAGAVRALLEVDSQLVEGAAGMAFAAAARWAEAHPGSRVLVISCGARLTPGELRRVLAA